jgi:hypothetical protein
MRSMPIPVNDSQEGQMPKADLMPWFGHPARKDLSRRIIRLHVIRDAMFGAWLRSYSGRAEFHAHLDGYS